MSIEQRNLPLIWSITLIEKFIDDRYIRVFNDDYMGVRAAGIWLIAQSYDSSPKPKEVYSSYHLKHRAEEVAGIYISDRDIELAAKILGIPYTIDKKSDFVDLPIHKPFVNRPEHFENLCG